MTKPPFNLVGLDHIVLLVDDMEKVMAFYQQVLGCRPDIAGGRNIDHFCISIGPFDKVELKGPPVI